MNQILKPFAKPLNRYTCGIGLGIDRIIMASATGTEVPDKLGVTVVLIQDDKYMSAHVFPAMTAIGNIGSDAAVILEFSPMTMTRIGKQYVIPLPAAVLDATDWTTGEKMEYQFLQTDSLFHLAIWRAK